jgi:DNA processing protein
LAETVPDVLVVSGLAYGTDIQAHRNALDRKLSTIAVLAHGLDRIYPASHRRTAIDMLGDGGLLTEFHSGIYPDKPNFVRRNRIIAGLADATVVIESADKGGSLITASIAFSYGRDVFAFPGRVSDVHSEGCNRIIRQNEAGLITSAADLTSALGWDVPAKKQQPVQMSLPLFEDETTNHIIAVLNERQEVHVNELAKELNMPVYKLADCMLDLEMSGYVVAVPGNMYRLKIIR